MTMISGHSMEPTYHNGDIVLTAKQSEYKVGDIIVYHPKSLPCDKCNIVHRVIAGDNTAGYSTEGDNNSFKDEWKPTVDEIIGKAIIHIPLGTAGIILINPSLWLFIVSVIIFIMTTLWFIDMRHKLKNELESSESNNDDSASIEQEISIIQTNLPQTSKPKKKWKILSYRFSSRVMKGIFLTLSILMVVSLCAASATALTVNVKTVGAYRQAKTACTTNAVSVTVDATNHISVSGIDASCNNLGIVVKLLAPASSSAIVASGTIAATTYAYVSNTVASPATVTSVKVRINGFAVPANWTYTGSDPINPGGGGFTVTTTYTQPASQQICANITVSTTSTTALTWTANLRVTGAPFNGDTNATHYQFGSGNYKFQSTTPTGDHFIVVGNTGFDTVISGTPRTFSICNYGTPAPSGRADGVTYTVTPGAVPAPGYYICQTFTVTTQGATVFYVGWDATVDLTGLAAAYHTQSGQIGHAYPPTGDYANSMITSTSYKIWGTGWSTAGIKDGSSQSFQVCWGG